MLAWSPEREGPNKSNESDLQIVGLKLDLFKETILNSPALSKDRLDQNSTVGKGNETKIGEGLEVELSCIVSV